MKKSRNKNVVFKDYTMGQAMLLPPDLDELIPSKHVVRVVHHAIERIDISQLEKQYKGGGTSSYHPKMMLKVLVYGYTQKLYSSRQIAKGLRENIHFMWLSGQNQPDFRTINRFRSSTLKPIIEEVFGQVVKLLMDDGYIQLENYFLDGTIVEANANRYSYIWKKSTEKYKQGVQEKIKTLWKQIESVNDEENERYGYRDLDEMEGQEISSEKLEKAIDELNERLSKKPLQPETKKAVRQLEKDYLPRLKKYEKQEALLDGKNSCSKTDADATFMRMKDDHLGTGQLKPAYNVQTGTEHQFIVSYSVHQRAGDTSHMIPHLKKLKKQLGKLPQNLVADAGYGSEENYSFLKDKKLGNYVKYPFFYRENKTLTKDKYRSERFVYNKSTDTFTCPERQILAYLHNTKSTSINGFESQNKVYQCASCSHCPARSACVRSDGHRTLRFNQNLDYFKQKARRNLLSPLGKKLRILRNIEFESVFGQIKRNMNFKQFHLRGHEKVSLEWGLISIAHNLKKIPA